jgi:hypothetical protein
MRSILTTAAAVGGLLTALAATHAASAVPLAKVQTAPQGIVSLAGRGGHGGHGGGGYGGGHGGGGHGAGHGIGHGIGHGGGGHGHGWGGGGGHHGHGLRFYGAPFVGYGAYYGSGYGYGSGCGWLRRRAEATGSGYWWARYEECVDDNY